MPCILHAACCLTLVQRAHEAEGLEADLGEVAHAAELVLYNACVHGVCACACSQLSVCVCVAFSGRLLRQCMHARTHAKCPTACMSTHLVVGLVRGHAVRTPRQVAAAVDGGQGLAAHHELRAGEWVEWMNRRVSGRSG
jgi:hypothetical protein